MKRSVSILGHKWKVKRLKDLKLNGEACFGLCDPDTRTIFIAKGLTPLQAERVFWHEYTHARLYESGVTMNTGGISPLAEEIICDTIAALMAYELNVSWKKR